MAGESHDSEKVEPEDDERSPRTTRGWIYLPLAGVGAVGIGLVAGALLDDTARFVVFPVWLVVLVLAGSVAVLVIGVRRRPPGDLAGYALTVCIAAGLAFFPWSVPGSFGIRGFVPVLLWIGVVICGLLIAIDRARDGRGRPSAIVHGLLVVGAPIVVGLAILVFAFDARFHLGKNDMDDVAGRILAGQLDPSEVEQIGLWRVEFAVKTGRRSVNFTTGQGVFLTSSGFLYTRAPKPPVDRAEYTRVGGYWYQYFNDDN